MIANVIALPRPCSTFQSLLLTRYIRVLLSKAFWGEGIVHVHESICQINLSAELFQQISISNFSLVANSEELESYSENY